MIEIDDSKPHVVKILIRFKAIPWSSPRKGARGMFSTHSRYKAFMKNHLRAAYKGRLLEGPLRCDLSFWLSNKNDSMWHTTKPDRINIAKLFEDILEGIFFKNDSAIVSGDVCKHKIFEEERSKIEIVLTEISKIDLYGNYQ